VNIFIDESGSFANTKQEGSWNTIVAYASPEVDSRKMKTILNRLKKKCGVAPSVEIKLKHILEHDYIDFLKDLYSLNGVLFCTATDASHNTLTDIAHHQNKRVYGILLHIDKMKYEGGRKGTQYLADQLQKLSSPLYAQLCCQVDLIFNTIDRLIPYIIQRMPHSLGKFRWRVDQKNISRIDYEDAFEKITPALLQTRSLSKPLIMIKGCDYSALDPYIYHKGETPTYLKEEYGLDIEIEEALNIQKIIRDDIKFEDSKKSVGIQIADLLASGMRRCLRGGFEQNNDVAFFLGKLMVQAEKNRLPLSIIAFKEGVIMNKMTENAIKIMGKSCKAMIKK